MSITDLPASTRAKMLKDAIAENLTENYSFIKNLTFDEGVIHATKMAISNIEIFFPELLESEVEHV